MIQIDDDHRLWGEWCCLFSWLAVAEHEAKKRHDGHLSVLRFTSGWKAMFGIPQLDYSAEGSDYHAIYALRTAESADAACRDLIQRERLLSRPALAVEIEADWTYRLKVRREDETP